ncbi:nuclear receptor ROR-gamma-like [Salvelinus fontinalis]|uniref:nuclear receptor ROR-gamma-like n=1 Tax=Salvelinus fontinalis TaxID=8038 RepID=UPI00248672C1|nr:nuclear receptor ROR-gamma-like [Salvelinus fontinalis]
MAPGSRSGLPRLLCVSWQWALTQKSLSGANYANCVVAGCGDLMVAVFDFAHSVCALRLTEQQMALFSSLVLINPDRPCIEDRGRVHRMRRDLELCLSHMLRRDNQESLQHKLYQKVSVLQSLCSLHVQKLHWFSQRYLLVVHSVFPPLYKELFTSDLPSEDFL